jgi:hypothetical protein
VNIIYPDGSGKLDIGTRSLHVPLATLVQLIDAGFEFFYFEGPPFHVDSNLGVEKTLRQHLRLGKPKRSRTTSNRERAPTRVSRVLVTDPDGNEYEVNNLLGWMKEKFPERYKSLYFAAIRGQPCAGYKVKHLGWVTLTVVGNEEFTRNTKAENAKRNKRFGGRSSS